MLFFCLFKIFLMCLSCRFLAINSPILICDELMNVNKKIYGHNFCVIIP